MKLYMGYIDLENDRFRLYSYTAYEIGDGVYRAGRPLIISNGQTLSQISKNYLELLFHIGKTNEDKVYVFYSFNEGTVVKKITDFVYKQNQQILERAQIEYITL